MNLTKYISVFSGTSIGAFNSILFAMDELEKADKLWEEVTMEKLVPNSVDAAVEKHVPTYEKIEDEILVKVNHVMEKEHYIEWISLVKENKEITVKLYPEQDAEVRFPYIAGSTIYAYCNKHGLWKNEVE